MGGGGFGRELAEYLVLDARAGLLAHVPRGVVDDGYGQAWLQDLGLPALGPIDDYPIEPDDLVLVAIGNPASREMVARRLEARGVSFGTYVHPSSYVAATAALAPGAIVCPQACVNAGASVGAHAVLNVFCSVGHGARVGDYAVLSPYAALNGDATIGAGSFLGTRATVFPRVSIGARCTVDSHSYVRRSVGDDVLVSSRGEYRELKKRV